MGHEQFDSEKEAITKMSTNYNDLSDTYDQTKLNPLRHYVDQFTLRQVLKDVREKSVLDLACGDGYYTRLVKTMGATQVVGVDVSKGMISQARLQEKETPLGITYHQQDVVTLDQLGLFDITLAVYLFPYAATHQHLRGMCQAIYRNLSAGGKLVAATFNPTLEKAELPTYQRYGVTVTAPDGLHDGANLIARLNVTDGSIELNTHYWSQGTYEQTLTDTGFENIIWHPMQISDEALKVYGKDYWQPYLRKSLDTILVAYKR